MFRISWCFTLLKMKPLRKESHLLLFGIFLFSVQQIYGQKFWEVDESGLDENKNRGAIKKIEYDVLTNLLEPYDSSTSQIRLSNESVIPNSDDATTDTSPNIPGSVNKILDELVNDKSTDIKFRLPITVIPNHYKINLRPYIFPNNFTFDGTVEITTTVVTASNKIVLHINEIVLKKIRVTVNSNPVTTTYSFDTKYQFLIIMMGESLKNGSEVVITIQYVGNLNAAMKGFYRSSYTDAHNETKWLAATHLEPVAARNMFPCFDEPALKATFQISVSRTADFISISNTRLNSTIKQGDYFIDYFERTPTMSTYLVALVVSNFESKSMTPTYSAFARPNAIDQVTYAASVMKPIVDYFERTLQHKYQLPKLDMIALPDFASGAMENWGLITYRESNMLYHPEHSPITSKQSIASVIAHEISHQWFGNLVSPQWWKYTWLSEGFARYYQYYATAQIESDWGMEDQFVVEQLQNAFGTDGLPTSHPMTYDVYSPTDISGIFDQISYGKGGSVLRMMEKVLGKDLFHAALHDYLEARKYNYGTPEYLFDALQARVDKNASVKLNVKEVMDSWTTHAGFPVVDVSINSNILTLSQERFLLRNPDNIDVLKHVWSIPISYATKSKPDFSRTSPTFWLNTKTSSLTLTNSEFQPNDWIIFNIQEAGFYRVNYDRELWNRLITFLKSKDFTDVHQLNRAALMDDVLNLARAGFIDYSFALSATQYLSQETHYIPWRAALNGLSYLKKQLTGKDVYELFKVHILTILKPIYNKLGFNEVTNESHFDKLLRRNIVNWACEFGVDDCIDNSLKLFANWRSNASKLVPVNSRMTVYCMAIKYGTLEDYDFLWNKYLTTDVPAERIVITNALGCSQNASTLEALLMTVIGTPSAFRSQDVASIFWSVSSAGHFGAQCVLDFVIQHHNDMYQYFGDYNEVFRIFDSISTQFTTRELIHQFQSFIEVSANTFGNDMELLNSYVTRANEELIWYDKNSPKIFEWLNTTYSSTEYRLPASIKPITYNIFLSPHLENDAFTFDGNITIRMNVTENISSIVLHAHALKIENIEVLEGSTKLKVGNHSMNSKTEKLTILLTTIVAAPTILTVNIKYSGILNNNMVGFYRSYYEDNNGTKHWLASTQFQKFGARQAFPCFDEPSFKARFTVNIERPKHYHSLSNMPLRNSEPSLKANYTWDHFNESEIMSSYLVAFIVSDFHSITNDVANFTVWSRPNAIEFAQMALDVGQKALSFLEKFTGINYPIDKMDLAAIPDFAAGAMENWGLVTFREYGLLASKNVTSATYMRYMATTIAHELVHMWFGDLVTCDWWEYVWLNEGFAEYLEYLVIDNISPEWDMNQHFISYELQVALLKDSYPHMRPMNNKMETPFDDGKDFTSIAYQKSASVIHMMHRAFGEDIFAEGLHTYLDQNKYKTGKPEYLWSAMQIHVDAAGGLTSTNESVAALMDSWANQAGYPVVHANVSDTHLRLTQERFLLTRNNETSIDQLYWVPITIATESDPNFNNISTAFWFGKKTQIVNQQNLNGGWFILNVQQSGYYRVNYEDDNWNKLIEALNEKNFGGIPETNRAQIIDDILNLARAGYIRYDFALTAIQYLEQEYHHLPWRAFFNAYAYLDERFDGHQVSEMLTKNVLKLTENVYKYISFEEADNDTQLMKTNRQLILSWICKLNHENCVEKSKKLFAQWRNNSNTFISADAKPAVICTSLRHGDYNDWDFMWKEYHKSNFESDKIVILNGLGCTQNTDAIHRYLNTIFSRDGSIRDQNVASAFASVYSSGKFGVNASLEFLITNYTAVHEYYGDWDSVSNLFASVASKFSTGSEIDRLKRFINELPEDLSEMTYSLNMTVSAAELSLEFVKDHESDIKYWLATASPTSPSAPGSSSIMGPAITVMISILNVLLIALH